MKVKHFKIITILIVIIMLFNYIMPTHIVIAGDVEVEVDSETLEGVPDEQAATQEIEQFENAGGDAFGILDGLVGIFTILERVKIVIVGLIGQMLTTLVARNAGTIDGQTEGNALVTPGEILFNKLYLVDIDFFNIDGLPKEAATIKTIRQHIVSWYTTLRMLAIIILLCILIYVGIRAAISTVAEQRAIYKKMLVDWLVSFVLVFIMHYIIRITISINNGLVSIFDTIRVSVEGGDTAVFGDIVGTLIGRSFLPYATASWGATIVYIMVVVITVAFLIMYLKRMITIAFLIIISPLVTITYSIDKMGDNTSQALNTWLKEFVYNILIQPFHCIIYLVFVTTAINILNGTLAGMILAIFMMSFIFQAEGIVRKIFGFEKASSLGSGLATAGAVYGGFKALQKLGGNAKSAGGSGGSGGSGGTGNSGGSGGTTGTDAASQTTKMPRVKGNPTSTVGKAASTVKTKVQNVSDSVRNQTKKIDKAISNTASKSKVGSAVYSGTKSVGNKMISGFKKSASSSGKFTGGVIGVATSMALNGPDNLGEIAGGAVVGSAIGGKVGAKTNQIKQNSKVKHNERILATAYDNLKASGGYTDQQLENMTQTILQTNASDFYKLETPSGIETDAAYQARTIRAGESQAAWQDRMLYAQSVHTMRNTYQKNGDQKPNDTINNTLRQIRTNKIKRSI